MRFLSLYIDAFGGIKRRAFDLSEGFTELLAENGAGKSTLAAFIKAMLYGLDGTGITRELTANEFLLYRPWDGGRFGGTLTFEAEGGTYRIERYFEDKRGANKHLGEYRVIDTATELPTEAFGEEPGRVLFGVDGESFLRTAYLSARGITAARTTDISAKLGGLDGEQWDMASAEDALKLIDKRRTEIRTKTKQRHGTKLLDVAERNLQTTRDRIGEATAAMEAETRERQSAAAIEERLKKSQERLAELTAIKETADRRQGEEKARAEQLTELSALLDADKAEIASINRHFPDAPPSAETLSALEADLSEYNHLEAAAARQGTVDTEEGASDADIASLRAHVAAREEARGALSSLPRFTADGTAGGAGQKKNGLLILGIILLLLCPPVGILLLVLYRKNAAKEAEAAHRAEEAARHAEEERARAEAHYRDAEEAAATALAAYGLPRDACNAEIDKLYAAALKARLAAEEYKKNTERMALLRARIEGTLSVYRDLPEVSALGVRVDALRGLCRRLTERQAMLVEHSTRLARLNAAAPQKPTGEAATEEVLHGIAVLKDAIAKDTAAAAAARERADGYRTLADGLDELYDLCEAQSAEVDRLITRMIMLDKTAALLGAARDALETKCLGGIRGRITAYTDRLLGKRFGEVRLNTDLALAFSEGGEGHSADYFSTGLRAIGDICLRLALTDELYPNDPPPLILDDPFMALDENNLRGALSLLSELAKTRQILYLTCHPSRSGKGE